MLIIAILEVLDILPSIPIPEDEREDDSTPDDDEDEDEENQNLDPDEKIRLLKVIYILSILSYS
jgi:hypothetical protein